MPVAPPPFPSSSQLSIRSPDEILGMEFDDSDVILQDRIMAEGQPLTIVGAAGTGKSRIGLQLAVCQILNRPFLGIETFGSPRKWLILQTENSTRRLSFDLRRAKAWAGAEWPLVSEHLRIHTLETENDALLNIEDCSDAISATIAKHEPDIVLFDPLNSFTLGDLNKDADMRAACTALGHLGRIGQPSRAIVILHHALTGRLGAARAVGYDRSSFGRNSKVLLAWTRAQINLAPASPDDNNRLIVSCGKNSNGPEFKPFAVHLNPDSMIYERLNDFDISQWQQELTTGKVTKPLCTLDGMVDLIDGTEGGLTKAELVATAIRETGISRAQGYRILSAAISRRLLRYDKSEKRCYRVRE